MRIEFGSAMYDKRISYRAFRLGIVSMRCREENQTNSTVLRTRAMIDVILTNI
jgi:hypothetical protein